MHQQLEKLEGRKIIYTNANRQHADDVLERLDLTHMFKEIFDIKNANYIPKPEITPYQLLIKNFDIESYLNNEMEKLTEEQNDKRKTGDSQGL